MQPVPTASPLASQQPAVPLTGLSVSGSASKRRQYPQASYMAAGSIPPSQMIPQPALPASSSMPPSFAPAPVPTSAITTAALLSQLRPAVPAQPPVPNTMSASAAPVQRPIGVWRVVFIV